MTMEQISYYTNAASFAVVIVMWFVFAGVFLSQKRPAAAPDKVGVPRSFIGLALQGLGFGVVWGVRRSPMFSPLIDDLFVLNAVFQIIAVVIVAASGWLAMSAIKELGKQWSLQARLIEGHKLVKAGVYGIVRHPIYTAMLGMLLGTGLTFSHWIGLVGGVAVFLIGTRIRTRIEEQLLSDEFGDEFQEWTTRVPGLVPFVKL